eukprot:PhF_6_TR9421/c0_g1_i1/m.14733
MEQPTVWELCRPISLSVTWTQSILKRNNHPQLFTTQNQKIKIQLTLRRLYDMLKKTYCLRPEHLRSVQQKHSELESWEDLEDDEIMNSHCTMLSLKQVADCTILFNSSHVTDRHP